MTEEKDDNRPLDPRKCVDEQESGEWVVVRERSLVEEEKESGNSRILRRRRPCTGSNLLRSSVREVAAGRGSCARNSSHRRCRAVTEMMVETRRIPPPLCNILEIGFVEFPRDERFAGAGTISLAKGNHTDMACWGRTIQGSTATGRNTRLAGKSVASCTAMVRGVLAAAADTIVGVRVRCIVGAGRSVEVRRIGRDASRKKGKSNIEFVSRAALERSGYSCTAAGRLGEACTPSESNRRERSNFEFWRNSLHIAPAADDTVRDTSPRQARRTLMQRSFVGGLAGKGRSWGTSKGKRRKEQRRIIRAGAQRAFDRRAGRKPDQVVFSI